MASGTFGALRSRLQELPRTLAASVATRAAPVLTGLTQDAYASTHDVYDQPRPVSEVDRKPLDLRRTGDAQRALTFVAIGTLVRVRLGTPYTKYLIGKYRILPNGFLPQTWRDRLGALVQETKAPS